MISYIQRTRSKFCLVGEFSKISPGSSGRSVVHTAVERSETQSLAFESVVGGLVLGSMVQGTA